jgi:mono/diheme cytochrome c family protein
MMTLNRKFIGLALALPLSAVLTGCTRDHKFQPVDMWNNTRLKPYEPIGTARGTTAMPMPAGVVARGQLRADDLLNTGRVAGQGSALATQYPFPVTEAVLRRGQERYQVFCAPCHGGLGDGNGVIVTRGFSKPPDYADQRLKDAPVGHFFDVITHGYGAMYSYADRVPVNDRWAITAYIRLLQKTRARGANKGNVVPGGSLYPPYLKPSAGVADAHGAHGAHGGDSHGKGSHQGADNSENTAIEGVAPGSHITGGQNKPQGGGEGPTHEKARGGDASEHSYSGASPAGGSGSGARP